MSSVGACKILLGLALLYSANGFAPSRPTVSLARSVMVRATADNEGEEEAVLLRKRAEELRAQIRKMEEELGENRPRNYDIPKPVAVQEEVESEMSLKKKRVLVVGANGRLGSLVCRYLLRNNPQTEVIACVHTVSENSSTSRGYGRLSYEVGAEDGVGSIGAAWSAEDRVATFEYADYMKEYNLKNLRMVECELLDPVQCQTICEGVDSVIWCATDFNGNTPRAVSGLNFAFLFRAIASPDKGRVEIEGLRNMLGGLKLAQLERKRQGDAPSSSKKPINFALVSTSPEAFGNYETPFGEFNGLKRQGEEIVRTEFPSLSYTILQMGLFDDNFVDEGQDILTEASDAEDAEKFKRRINRRDAALGVSEALTNEELVGKTVQMWTAERR
jgi:hypothetical protein